MSAKRKLRWTRVKDARNDVRLGRDKSGWTRAVIVRNTASKTWEWFWEFGFGTCSKLSDAMVKAECEAGNIMSAEDEGRR